MTKVGRPAGRNPLLNLRIDPVLHEYLKLKAASNGRTVTAEVTFRLLATMIEEKFASRIAPSNQEENAA